MAKLNGKDIIGILVKGHLTKTETRTIVPTTDEQVVTPNEGYNALSSVTVKPVDSSIDSNIIPENVKMGVEILGVTGSLEEHVEPTLQSKTITPSTSQQNIIADDNYDGLSEVVVEAVESIIDSNISPENIKSGVEILGVTGTLEEGITPSGTLIVTENGTHDATNYATVEVNVPDVIPDGYEDVVAALTEEY